MFLQSPMAYAASSNGLNSPTVVDGISYQYKIVTTNLNNGDIKVVIFNDGATTCGTSSCSIISVGTTGFIGNGDSGGVAIPSAVYIQGNSGNQGVNDALSYVCSNFDYQNCSYPANGNSGRTDGDHYILIRRDLTINTDLHLLNKSDLPIKDWEGDGENDYGTTTGDGTLVAPFTAFIGATVGTSTLPSETNLLSFINVPYLLQTRVPFAYFFQIAEVVRVAISSSTIAATIPSATFSVEFPTGNSTTTIEVDMFSTSTITYFLTPTWVDLLRTLMVAVTFAATGLFFFHEARSKKHL